MTLNSSVSGVSELELSKFLIENFQTVKSMDFFFVLVYTKTKLLFYQIKSLWRQKEHRDVIPLTGFSLCDKMSLCSLEDLLISIKRCEESVCLFCFVSQGDRHQQSLTSSFWRLPVGWRCMEYACIQPRTGKGQKSTWLLPTQAFWCFRLELLGF